MVHPAEFKRLIDFVYSAHQEHCTKKDFRQHGKVPFVVHPLWCALMLLNDTRIPYEERQVGYQVLLLHDILEDTSLPLPEYIEPVVADLVKEMTHASWEEEKDIEGKTPFLQLLKLCDKLASMYDENVRPDTQRRHEWKQLMETLLKSVSAHYPDSRIVTTARAVMQTTNW